MNPEKRMTVRSLVPLGIMQHNLTELTVQLAEIHRHPWVTAGTGCRGGEIELELPMMSVVQTHILPTEEDCDPDVLQAITSLGCFKDRKKLIEELLNPK